MGQVGGNRRLWWRHRLGAKTNPANTGNGMGLHRLVLTLLFPDVHKLGDKVLQLCHTLAHCGLQRLHPGLFGPGNRSVHVAHILDCLRVTARRTRLFGVQL